MFTEQVKCFGQVALNAEQELRSGKLSSPGRWERAMRPCSSGVVPMLNVSFPVAGVSRCALHEGPTRLQRRLIGWSLRSVGFFNDKTWVPIWD